MSVILPTIIDREPRCSGNDCLSYIRDAGGWHCQLTGTGQRLPGGGRRICKPAVEQLSPTRRVRAKVVVLPAAEGLELPKYETPSSAGMDVRAAVAEAVSVAPGSTVRVPTGLIIAVPRGYQLEVRPRSGLALRSDITVPNSPGTIDADYRGELGILLRNEGGESFEVTRGMRIAQLVVMPAIQAVFDVVDVLDETERGAGGFGSTGVS